MSNRKKHTRPAGDHCGAPEVSRRSAAEVRAEGVLRLRVADAEETQRNREAGEAAGEKWAINGARPEHLRWLNRAWGRLAACDADTGRQAVALYRAITCDWSADGDEADRYWQSVLGEDDDMIRNPDFVEGFVRGALAVWAEATRRR
jgi:hypothetical protein